MGKISYGSLPVGMSRGRVARYLIGATMLFFSSPAFSITNVNTCQYWLSVFRDLPAVVSKGAFYTMMGASGGEYMFCFEVFSETAQGACDALIQQINAEPLYNANFHLTFSSVEVIPTPNPVVQIGAGYRWGECGLHAPNWPRIYARVGLYKLREPDALAITITGGTEVEPSNGSNKKFLPIIATVIDQSTNQPPTNPIKIHVSLKVEDLKSGGHDHGDSTRPRGGIAEVENCASDSECWPSPQSTEGKGMTDGNGQVVFNFNAPEASGKYTITAICDGCSSSSEPKTVDVRVSGIKPIPPSGLYALYETDGSVIGAVKNRHESNHYLTPTAANKLLVIAINYHYLYPKDPVLHVNDASLMWGGVFDIDPEAEWNSPHKEHRRGSVVDIRANSKTGSIPPANFDAFIQSAKDRGVDARKHNSGKPDQHFHVRLLNRSE